MAAIHELYGLQAEELEKLRIEYGRVIQLLTQLKTGRVPLDRLVITDNGWQVVDLPKATPVRKGDE